MSDFPKRGLITPGAIECESVRAGSAVARGSGLRTGTRTVCLVETG